MVDVRYLLVDEVSGKAFAELPLEFDGPIQFRKNDVGQVQASMPCDHPAVTKANIEDGLRSITALRDGSAEASLLLGPWDVDTDSRTLNLTLFEPSAYFDVRVVETDKDYSAEDRVDIVNDVWTEVTTKTSTSGDGTASAGTDILADIPRFSVTSTLSGFTMDLTGSGIARHTMAEYLQKVSENPDEGLEWCMDYRTGSTLQACHRTLTLGAPLGATLDITLTDQMLVSWGKSANPLAAATRMHARIQGYTATKQNTGSITDGWPLIDQTVDRPDVSSHTHAANIAREQRRRRQPPVRAQRLSYRPNVSLPFGWASIGDVISFNVDDPCDLLNLTANSKRVEGIDWYPPQAGQLERVDLLLHSRLDETGA